MNTSSQAASISAVIVTITVLFGLVGSMSPALNALTFLSPYKYISVYSIVSGGSSMFFIGIIAGVVMSIISIMLSCARYNKIDFILD